VTLVDLVARWRAEADVLHRRGAPELGEALTSCATELAEALAQHEREELTIAQAAAESGYSASQLRRRFPGRQTIPRASLPRKGAPGGPDLAGAVLRAPPSGRR
jgi:hypothetical protein